jgi:hypothetical protein
MTSVVPMASRLLDRVRDEDDGPAGLPPDAPHLGLHDPAILRIERAERLVHQQELGLDGQRPGDGRALAHPAAHATRVVVLEAGQPDQAQ